MGDLEKLKGFLLEAKSKPKWVNPEEDDDPKKHQFDELDSDAHGGQMFLADLKDKKITIDVPKKLDPKKFGIDLIGSIVLTGMDDERLKSLKHILKSSKAKVPVYMTRDLYRQLKDDLGGDFDNTVDEHIVKEDAGFDINGVSLTLSRVEGSNELRLTLKSGEEYHQGSWLSKSDKREQLASLIHAEWMSWSKAVANKVSPEKRAKWEKLWIPYEELTEAQKDKDRIWADKALAIMGKLEKSKSSLRDVLSLIKERGIPTESSLQPPGPPPRPGLEWKPETHRWIRPADAERHANAPATDYASEHDQMEKALETLRVSGTAKYVDVGDEWTPESVEVLKENADVHLSQFEKLFDATTYNKARTAAYAIINTARGARTSASPAEVQMLVQDSIDKLVYQEMRAWKRQVSDHGIRHIVGDLVMNERISNALINGGINIKPSDRFMMAVIAVNHDLGYTMGDARTTLEGTKKHKQYSQEWFDNERESFKHFFTDAQLDLMSDAIAHHDDTAIDWENDPVLTTICVADNLSLFHEDKLPSLYRYVDGALDTLYEMQRGIQANDLEAVDRSKVKLIQSINDSDLPEYSKSWLRQAANEVSKYTAKYTLPMLVGNISHFDFNKDKGLEIDVNEDPFDDQISNFIDMGQTQYAKFAKDYGADLKDNDNVEFKKDGKTLLSLKIKRHHMQKMMYGLYAIDMLLKAGKQGLVPKKIMVTREGKQFMQIVYVKPGAEGADIYKRFLEIPYNKFFGKRAAATNEAMEAVSKEIKEQRIKNMGAENHYRAMQLLADWVEGLMPRIISIRMIAAKMHGKEFTKEQTTQYVKAVSPGISDNGVDIAYSLAKAMSLYFDEKHPEPSMDFFVDILKAEKKFASQKARDLFGDKIIVYRGVYGPVAKTINKTLHDKGEIELEEFPYTSYTQDMMAAFAFVHQKPNYLVFKQEMPVEDIASAWFVNPMMTVSMPEQKEVVVDREVQKVVLKPSDVVINSEH